MNYFSNICRICMSRGVELISIYQTDDDMLTYIDKLNTCIPEIFTPDNYIPLPDQICELCCKNLKIVFWFRELCLKSNTLLRNYKLQLENNAKKNTTTKSDQIVEKCTSEKKTCEKLEDNDDCATKCNKEETDSRKKNVVDIPLSVECDISTVKTELSEEDDSAYNNDFTEVVLHSPEITEHKIELEECSNIEADSTKLDESKAIRLENIEAADARKKLDTPPLIPTPSELVIQPIFHLASEVEETPLFHVTSENLKSSGSEIHEPHEAPSEGKKMRHLCSFCGKPFKFRQDMRVHERIHTGYKPYSCTICSKTFAKSTRLKIHMNTHTREKSYTCTICSKNFNQNSNLIVHMRLHTQTERFACHLCEKTFSQKRHLKQHILFHEDERRYTCEICNWNFTMKHHLKRHMMTHSGQRPPRKELPRERERKFPCTMCEWSFMSKEVLKRHMAMHTRENAKLRTSLNDERRRFPCPLCVWSFTKKHHLERHMVKHEENRRFPCTLCTQEFRKNYELQRHLKTHTQEEYNNVQVH